MNRRQNVLSRIAVAAVVAGMGASGLTAVARADAAALFNGPYTVTQQAANDPATGAGLPQVTARWIVLSTCTMPGCTAAVAATESLNTFTMLFDGNKWTRLSTGDTATCGGATVPASANGLFLVRRGDGSYSGVRTVTVPCGGASANLSQPLTVTPVRA